MGKKGNLIQALCKRQHERKENKNPSPVMTFQNCSVSRFILFSQTLSASADDDFCQILNPTMKEMKSDKLSERKEDEIYFEDTRVLGTFTFKAKVLDSWFKTSFFNFR